MTLPPTMSRNLLDLCLFPKDPRPAEAWEGELDASQLPPPCAQFVLGGREDCLYLNVYTPQVGPQAGYGDSKF